MARRLSLVLAPVGFLLMLQPALAEASEPPQKHHAVPLIGEPAHGAEFTHCTWVNPDAPKGGRVREMAYGTFDTLNPFSIKGNPASRLGLIYDSLMQDSPDEASTSYGLIAEWV